MHSKPKKTRNYGVEILRMIMAFFVIIEHCYKPKNITLQNIVIILGFHVPTFLIISFYYLNNNLVNRKVDKIKERLKRLLIPYLFYPIIIYIAYNLLYIFFHFETLRKSLYQLIIQFIVGRLLCSVLWFQFNLILITVLFYIIAFIFKSYYLPFLKILGILSYALQYSNINYKYFKIYKDYIRFSVGYFAETLPIAVTGLFISSIDLINILKKKYSLNIILYTFFLFILFKYRIFSPVNGFGKQGILYNIEAVSFFVIFSLIQFENFNKKILTCIKYLTRFTPGVYFLHTKIYLILKIKISLIKNHTFLGCLLIYLISYLISFIGYNSLKKNKLKHLFI